MIVGAGLAGQSLIHDIQYGKRQNGVVCCLIDDNKNKWGLDIDGIRVVGGRDKIAENVKNIILIKSILQFPALHYRIAKILSPFVMKPGVKLKRYPACIRLSMKK